jgi:hypothetical protein
MVLAAPISLWVDSWKARARFAQALTDMQNIAAAAQKDFAIHHRYAPPVMPAVMPDGFEAFLSSWPQAPCPGWVYTWDHWASMPGTDRTLRVTLRNSALYSVYYLCLNAADCASPTVWGHGEPIEISTPQELRCEPLRSSGAYGVGVRPNG